MSVWRRFHGHGFPSLVTTNVAERRPVFGEDGAARRFIEVMRSSATDEGAYLIAWAIMPEHVHFIVSLPATGSLGRLVQLIKGRFAREYNSGEGRHWELLAEALSRASAAKARPPDHRD